MINRELKDEVLRLGSSFQVLILTGPRQSGKTTLCKMAFPEYKYVNLENPDSRALVESDPMSFLRANGTGMILDEAQQLPELFSYIQVLADEDKSLRYVLSGSNNFALMEKVTQSLAGRAALLTLLPLSIAEMGGEVSTDELMVKGFYPGVWGDGKLARDVYSNYYQTYIERDLRQLVNIKDLSLFGQFVRLAASRVSCEINALHMSNDLGIDVKTVQHWLSILHTSYITHTLPPYYRNVGKRIVKAHKLYFYDTGLACFLLGIESVDQLSVHPLRGALFENMVVAEFKKRRFNQGRVPQLYYYRDNMQKEVDLIEELAYDSIYAYEIKSARRFSSQFTVGLNYLSGLYGDTVQGGMVLYDGDESIAPGAYPCVNWRDGVLQRANGQ